MSVDLDSPGDDGKIIAFHVLDESGSAVDSVGIDDAQAVIDMFARWAGEGVKQFIWDTHQLPAEPV